MAKRCSPESLNKQLMSYYFFNSKDEARKFIAQKRWRKFILSANIDGTCWTVYHKQR